MRAEEIESIKMGEMIFDCTKEHGPINSKEICKILKLANAGGVGRRISNLDAPVRKMLVRDKRGCWHYEEPVAPENVATSRQAFRVGRVYTTPAIIKEKLRGERNLSL